MNTTVMHCMRTASGVAEQGHAPVENLDRDRSLAQSLGGERSIPIVARKIAGRGGVGLDFHIGVQHAPNLKSGG